jgi:ABC-type branched-subunit amino acid transport system ATPase component
MLTVEGLRKEFGSLVAVRDVDLTLRKGEIHGLIGPNGAGKTTTVDLITGELAPTGGTVRLDGEDIGGLSPADIARRGIGRSFQVVQYFPDMTVREHLHLAVRDPSQTLRSLVDRGASTTDRVEQVAERVHLGDALDVVAKNLSHGEKRFLDIGVVLGVDADLLLLDEPAAGLNASETAELQRIIEDLRGEYTILIIEHDIDLIRRLTDRITVLHNGAVLATDEPESIVENEEVKEVYLGE